MKMMKQFLLTAMFAAAAVAVQAQCTGFNWSDDAAVRATEEEKNVVYTDALKAKDFKLAEENLVWFLENNPKFNTSLYINGDKIYNGLIKEATDDASKDAYVEKLLNLYDMRIENCGQKEDVTARKAYAAYRNNIKKPGELKNILDLFNEAADLNGTNLPDYMLVPWMNAVKYNKKYLDNLSEEEILAQYEKISEIIDAKIAAESDPAKKAKLNEYKDAIDGLFTEIFKVDCDFVKEKLEPKFKADPNVKMAKTIFKFMLDGKCTDDPLWIEAGRVIANEDPSYGLFKNLGLKAKSNGNAAMAEELFFKANEFATTPSEKSEILLITGALKAENGQKVAARTMYRKALEVDPTAKEAYNRIGILYFTSYEQCRQGKSKVDDRLVFLLAYDMFMRGGNGQMARDAKEQFPSKEEIFELNINAGDKASLGCWIGETTTIRTRD